MAALAGYFILCIQAFQLRIEVSNYPLQKRPQQEMQQLNRVVQLRKIEMAEVKVITCYCKLWPRIIYFNRLVQLTFPRYKQRHSIQRLMMNTLTTIWVQIWVSKKKKETRTLRPLLVAEGANMEEKALCCTTNLKFIRVKRKTIS